MSNAPHWYLYDKAVGGHVCANCGRTRPVPTDAELSTANAALDRANALGKQLGVSLSVSSLALADALGLHAMISVNTDQGFTQTAISQDAQVFHYVNGAAVESIPSSFRKHQGALRGVNVAQVAEWTRAQLLRYPDDAPCAS